MADTPILPLTLAETSCHLTGIVAFSGDTEPEISPS